MKHKEYQACKMYTAKNYTEVYYFQTAQNQSFKIKNHAYER